MNQPQSIGQVIRQTNPLGLINYSVQLRQHGDKSYRDKIVYFQAPNEDAAWKQVEELYNLADPTNKHMTITRIKSELYPTYSFANTYSEDWYFVLHWRVTSTADVLPWDQKPVQQRQPQTVVVQQPVAPTPSATMQQTPAVVEEPAEYEPDTSSIAVLGDDEDYKDPF